MFPRSKAVACRRSNPLIHFRSTLVALTVAAMPLLSLAQSDFNVCGSLENGFGPYDYRVERGQNLRLVEGAHFTPAVEGLLRGNTAKTPGGDLDYTLRAYPNHHRALMSVMRYSEKLNSPHPRDLRYSVECYFDRAVRFRADDPIVRMIFATFLAHQKKRMPDALKQLETARELAKDNAFTHYNIGLIYLDLKEYDRALAQAHVAYALGFTQPALREGLVAAGRWKEPDPSSPAAASAPARPSSDAN